MISPLQRGLRVLFENNQRPHWHRMYVLKMPSPSYNYGGRLQIGSAVSLVKDAYGKQKKPDWIMFLLNIHIAL